MWFWQERAIIALGPHLFRGIVQVAQSWLNRLYRYAFATGRLKEILWQNFIFVQGQLIELRLIARITSSVQACFILHVFSWGTKSQISFKKLDVKVCSINFEPPDNDFCSACHVHPLSRGAWIISILFILNGFTFRVETFQLSLSMKSQLNMNSSGLKRFDSEGKKIFQDI